MVEYEPMTINEILVMEPACLVIGLNKAKGNDSWGIPEGVFPKGAEPKWTDYPMLYIENTSSYAQWFHHYCWGELVRFRYFAATNPDKKARYLNKWMDALTYSLDAAKARNNRWSYLNKVRSDLAAAQLESKKFALAATTASEVIAAAPDIESTHSTLIDALVALKKKPEAETATVEALKRFGKKKSLVRRYKALTGKEPDIPDPEPVVVAAPSPTPTPPESAVPQVIAPAREIVPTPAPVQETVFAPAKIGNETNPFCRFCPDPAPPKP